MSRSAVFVHGWAAPHAGASVSIANRSQHAMKAQKGAAGTPTGTPLEIYREG